MRTLKQMSLEGLAMSNEQSELLQAQTNEQTEHERIMQTLHRCNMVLQRIRERRQRHHESK